VSAKTGVRGGISSYKKIDFYRSGFSRDPYEIEEDEGSELKALPSEATGGAMKDDGSSCRSRFRPDPGAIEDPKFGAKAPPAKRSTRSMP
jgi:hypothetical protein